MAVSSELRHRLRIPRIDLSASLVDETRDAVLMTQSDELAGLIG